MKRALKRTLKKSLLASKKVLSKSKTVKRAGVLVKDTLFPGLGVTNIYDYSRFAPTIRDYQEQQNTWKNFKSKPLISVVMPTYNTPLKFLEECIESVQIQSYGNWELCIADDASPNKAVVKLIKKYAAADKRIKLVERKENGHISLATNSAIEIASGEYIALLDHDDVLWPNALYEIVKELNDKPGTDFVYTDEDKIDSDGRIHSYPFFKPDWSPEFLESCNYITHFSCIRKSTVDKVGGFRKGYEGAQDWDLFLRVADETQAIVHLPKVLYSWRVHEDSTAHDTDAKPYVYEAQRNLLLDHVKRGGKSAKVKQGVIKQHSSIEYEVEDEPLVSIVVYGDDPKQFKKSLSALQSNTRYKKTEYHCITNNPKILRTVKSDKLFKTISEGTSKFPDVIEKVSGEYVVLADTTTMVASKKWLEFLLGDAQRPGVGIVGGKTIDKEGERIMRAAVGIGIFGLAAPLLEGMPVEDVHYMRGLYGQSRRNVSAVDSGCVMFKKQIINDIGGFNNDVEDLFIIDACLKSHKKGYRNIYNPFITSIDLRNLTAGNAHDLRSDEAREVFARRWSEYIKEDPYLNPHFSKTNAQLEII